MTARTARAGAIAAIAASAMLAGTLPATAALTHTNLNGTYTPGSGLPAPVCPPPKVSPTTTQDGTLTDQNANQWLFLFAGRARATAAGGLRMHGAFTVTRGTGWFCGNGGGTATSSQGGSTQSLVFPVLGAGTYAGAHGTFRLSLTQVTVGTTATWSANLVSCPACLS